MKSFSSSYGVVIDIPVMFYPVIPMIFQAFQQGFVAHVIDSGNDWVELATAIPNAIVKFKVVTQQAVRLYPGAGVHFDVYGNLLTQPTLAASRRKRQLGKPKTLSGQVFPRV